MNCRDLRPLLARYVDGEVEGYQQTLIQQHLMSCKVCAAAVSELKMARQRVQREIRRWAASVLPPAKARECLLAKLAAEKDTPVQTVMPITHHENAINTLFKKGMALTKRIVLAGLIIVVIAAFLVLIFRHSVGPHSIFP